jgi:positive regulator of sigma E activity
MQTPYDWVTVAIFAGLIVIFLQRSQEDSIVRDKMISYLPPAVGCAVANYLGNEDQHIFAIITVVLVLGYIALVIKPYEFFKRR